MEIDTGASLSIMSEQEFLNFGPERSVVATDVTLHSYLVGVYQWLGP